MGDGFELKSITAFQVTDDRILADTDSFQFSILPVDQQYDDSTFTQEFNLNISRGIMNGVMGLFYLDEN